MDTNTISAADTASGIELTPKGEAYCEARKRLERRLHLLEILHAAFDVADECIAELDAMDGDSDLEPFLAGFDGIDDDREADYEHGKMHGGSNGCADFEPAIGTRRA